MLTSIPLLDILNFLAQHMFDWIWILVSLWISGVIWAFVRQDSQR